MKKLYDALYQNIQPLAEPRGFQTRQPFQSSKVNYKVGFISWFILGVQEIATPNYIYEEMESAIKVESVHSKDIFVRFECEKQVNQNLSAFEMLNTIQSYLNTYDAVINFKNLGFSIYPTYNQVTSDVYFFENRDWINKSTLDVRFGILDTFIFKDDKIAKIEIETILKLGE